MVRIRAIRGRMARVRFRTGQGQEVRAIRVRIRVVRLRVSRVRVATLKVGRSKAKINLPTRMVAIGPLLGRSWLLLGHSWLLLSCSWVALGRLLAAHWPITSVFQCRIHKTLFFERKSLRKANNNSFADANSRSWLLLDRSWLLLGYSWLLLSCSWVALGRSWAALGRTWADHRCLPMQDAKQHRSFSRKIASQGQP